MAEITELLYQFPEEIFQNTLKGKIITGEIKWENKPILVHLEKMDSTQLLFSLDEKPLRIAFGDVIPIEINIEPEISSYFQILFWIYNVTVDMVEIKYLKTGNGQKFRTSLDIGFGDNIIMSNKTLKIEKISENLLNDFVFRASQCDLIFIQTYPDNIDKSFTIYGSKRRADILVTDNKWIITKITNKPFPKKHSDFLLLNIAQYNTIMFVESSKASEAYETIKAEEAKGNTLISLWQIYSDLELQRSNLLKEKIGELKYSIIKYLPEGVTRVKILNLTGDLKNAINENKDDILNSSFEIIALNDDIQKNENQKRFSIKVINSDFTFDLYDDLNLLSEKGSFSISLIGDEIVNKRRKRALASLREDRKFITRNLLFAIEGAAGAMLEKKRNEKPLTERTRKFLKEKFGINDLTLNQKEAVSIAINTPDIAIIQGPPGTGKSTVVAAICDRLIEISEKSKKNFRTKLILVSAFQNDTVEHIASKIYTLGLPTIKIGKETQSNIRAEDLFIDDIKKNIAHSLQTLSSLSNTHRISRKLKDIRAIHDAERNDSETKQRIDLLLKTTEISNELWKWWKDITCDQQYNDIDYEKTINAIKGLRTEFESYNDDGFYKIQKILKVGIPFSNEEREFLEFSPDENPNADFLLRIKHIKEKYLEEINIASNTISSGNNLSLSLWMDEAIRYFTTKEEVYFEDDDTFFTANLEALSDELDGNVDYIRDTIKSYGESLAATNQVAGSREMSSYEYIENVILEEAARSNPLDLLIPMSKATERIIMVGDQNQLPHLLEDDIADETSIKLSTKFNVAETRIKLEESLFGVIFKNLKATKPIRTLTLTEQFRMHPFIGDFISKIYYNGSLKPGISNQADLKKHGLQLNWAKDKVAIFCDVRKGFGHELNGKSKSRSSEAVRIIKLLDELKTDSNFENLSVGIITFYAKQVEELLKEAAKKGYTEQKPDGAYEISKQYKETNDKREKLRIGSVDSFQGKEFDIVILSTVRSNNISRIHENYKKVFGFLTLENRLNVAFSRSQKLIIVVGNSDMFSDEFAKTYVEGLHEFYTNLSNDTRYGNRIQ